MNPLLPSKEECGWKSWVRKLKAKQKQGAPPNRTHPEKSTDDSDMYNREFPRAEFP